MKIEPQSQEVRISLHIPGLTLQSPGDDHRRAERQALDILLRHAEPRLATVAIEMPSIAIPARLEWLAVDMASDDVCLLLRAEPTKITIERWTNDPLRFDAPVSSEDLRPLSHYMWRWQARSARGVVSVVARTAAELRQRGAHDGGGQR